MTQKHTALVLGGSIGDVPLVQGLRDAGYRVAVLGNATEAPAHRLADASFAADFSDPSVCSEIARRIAPDAVVPGSNDYAAISAAAVAEHLDLPGHDPVETVRTLNLKERFRALQSRVGLPLPAFGRVDGSAGSLASAAELRFPVIVKPTDLSGGKGIRTVDRAEDLKQAVSHALAISRRPEVIVEEYLAGTRHGVTSMIKAGTVTFSFVDDEQYLPGGFRVVGTSPTTLDHTTQSNVVRQLELLTRAASLVDGLLHAQFIATPDGPVLVEVTRRAPGDLYPWFVEAAVGYPYVQAILMPYLGRSVPGVNAESTARDIARWIVVSREAGRYAGVAIAPGVRPAVLNLHEAYRIGEVISGSGSTLAVAVVDASALPPAQPTWSGGALGSIWPVALS